MIVKKFLRSKGVALVNETGLLVAKDLVARVVDCRSTFRVDIMMIAKPSSRSLLSYGAAGRRVIAMMPAKKLILRLYAVA